MAGVLANKIAIVTGSSSGLGRAIAVAFAEAGAYVVCADIGASPPKMSVAELVQSQETSLPTHELLEARWPSSSQPRATFVTCDVSMAADVAKLIDNCIARYGTLDIMVNNAGIAPEAMFPSSFRVHEFPEDVWDRTMAVNGKGTWLGCKYAVRQMLRQEPRFSDRGWIINIGSVAAVSGQPVLIAPKSAFADSQTRAIAMEYAHDRIHVNCIHPSFTGTSMLQPMMLRDGVEVVKAALEKDHPWGRLGRPEEIAAMAVFLASGSASWITGQAFTVDGGYTAH
ncbi:hypothetical protein H2200_011844 [Cladophialophora chaetospira]|uniref:Uncharacterized protein n=1 Tax=Cladophialophora chaetospira TaxID=386627 RepID=A0AA38WYW8_9EURO|nr:hypothetical protein H2200_011844 [Cladophialophora chaetospira]